MKRFTFMLADSPRDDFSEGSRTDGQVSDHPAVAFDGIAFLRFDGGVIAAGFASESKGTLRLRRVIIRMGAVRFVRAIRSTVFSRSSLSSIIIPRKVEIIDSHCFSYCKSFSSVSIESGSLLRRIEQEAFCSSSLWSIVILRTAEIVHGSAFSNCKGLFILVEEGSKHLVVVGYFLQSFDGSILIRYFGGEDTVWIPRTVEILGSYCFSSYNSLSSVLIESGSLLRRIESRAFSSPNLRFVCLPVDVQFIAAHAFPDSCKVLRK
jgi:hypothetical protein